MLFKPCSGARTCGTGTETPVQGDLGQDRELNWHFSAFGLMQFVNGKCDAHVGPVAPAVSSVPAAPMRQPFAIGDLDAPVVR